MLGNGSSMCTWSMRATSGNGNQLLKDRCIMHFCKTSSECCKWPALHRSSWQRSSTHKLYSRVTADWNAVCKAMYAVLRKLCRSVLTKRELLNTADLSVFKSVFVSILIYGHESLVMTDRILSHSQGQAAVIFLWNIHGMTPRDKDRNCEISKPVNVEALSKSRDASHVGSVMCPESSRKDWRSTSCWLHLHETDPEVDQGPGGVTTSPTLLSPVLVRSQQNYFKLLLVMRYFESSKGCCTRDPPQRKPGYEN